jgi:hypothetical protein
VKTDEQASGYFGEPHLLFQLAKCGLLLEHVD